MQGLITFFSRLGAARLAAMVVVAMGLVGFFGYMIMRITTPPMGVLFSDLSVDDSAAILKELDRQQIKYQIRGDGSQILVPADIVPRTRMRLAEGGMPKGGGMGYEIFDKGDALSTTSFVQNINQLRALEGELGRSIRGIDRVQSARVHLVLPERSLFARDTVPPSASIVLKLRGQLESSQISAIRHLVASAVKGLQPQRISIVDESGRLLADGAGDPANAAASNSEERRISFEKRLREQVEEIIASVVGPGRTRVQVNADMDFNRITQTLDDFDPERKVVRSTQTREEQSQSSDGSKDGQVSVGNELPGANNGANGSGGSKEASKKTEELVNYEIARTQRTEVIEGGRVKRLSVAVLVDGVYTRDPQGAVTYAPRAPEEIDRIGALVRTTIGYDQKRGDQVEVINLRFAEAPALPAAVADKPWWMLFEPTKDDLRWALEMGVLLIVSLLVLLMVVRPLLKKVFSPEVVASLSDGGAHGGAHGGAAGGGPTHVITQADGTQITVDEHGNPTLAPGQTNETLARIELAEAAGQVHAASVAKVAELIESNPYETAAIIRQWLTSPAVEEK